MNKQINDYIQKWLSAIEVGQHIEDLGNSEDKQMTWNLFELLEKCIS